MDPLKGQVVPDDLQTADVMQQGDEFIEDDDFFDDGSTPDEEGGEQLVRSKAPSPRAKVITMIAVLSVLFLGVVLILFMTMNKRKDGTGILNKGDGETAPLEQQFVWVEFRGQQIQVPLDPETGMPIMPPFKYTEIEKEELRRCGYTGTDIETFEIQEIEPSILIENAEKAQQEWAEQFIAPYYDTASDEWRQVINTTWYGLAKVESYDPTVATSNNYSYNLNADYEKVPLYGHQCFLKIYLNSSGDYAFMSTTASRYAELPDSGNIVVNVYYTQTADGFKCITDITEVRFD